MTKAPKSQPTAIYLTYFFILVKFCFSPNFMFICMYVLSYMFYNT